MFILHSPLLLPVAIGCFANIVGYRVTTKDVWKVYAERMYRIWLDFGTASNSISSSEL